MDQWDMNEKARLEEQLMERDKKIKELEAEMKWLHQQLTQAYEEHCKRIR